MYTEPLYCSMAQNPCALCGEHDSLPKQEVCAICANDSQHAAEAMSDEPAGKLCADPDQFEGVDWDEEHRRAAESGELYDDHEYSYY